MNRHQYENLVIFLICFRSLATQQYEFRYVTKNQYTQFGSLLCSPGAYINISGVYGCFHVTSHCNLPGSYCNLEYHEDHEYYQLVVSKCNGRVACTGLYPLYILMRISGDCYGYYTYHTTIQYQCLPVDQDDQGAHYHYHAIQCPESPFLDLSCPDNTYINVTEVLLGDEMYSRGDCAAEPEECVKSSLDPLIQGMAICNGLKVCGLTINQHSGYWCEGRRRETDYQLLLYQCLQNPASVHYTCQSGIKRTLTAPKGTVVSPGYPGQYYNNTDCAFLIRAPENYKVEITFKMFRLERRYECNNDYLYVYDGLHDTAPWRGKFCGNILPDQITSTSNNLLISFHSDEHVSAKGFIFEWRFMEKGVYYTCHWGFIQNLTTFQGTVVSPGYPGQYYYGTDCDVYISAPTNNIIEIKFSSFNLEGRGSSDQCYDYLDVYDGPGVKAPLLGRFCGDTLPEPISSTANDLLISFHSDEYVNARGFVVIWRFIQISKPTTEDATTVTTLDITTLDSTPSPTPSSRQPSQTTQTVLPPVTEGKTLPESLNNDLVLYTAIPVAALVMIAIIISVTIIMVKRRKKPTTESLHAEAVTYDNHQGQVTIQNDSLSHTGRQAVENVYNLDNQEPMSFGNSVTGHNNHDNDILPDYEDTAIESRDHNPAPSHHVFPGTIYQNYNPREANRQRAHVEVAPSGEVYSLVQKTAKRHTEDDYDLAQSTGSDYEYSLAGDAYNTVEKNEQEYGTVLVDNATYGAT